MRPAVLVVLTAIEWGVMVVFVVLVLGVVVAAVAAVAAALRVSQDQEFPVAQIE
jgi:hypothetical protein